MVTSSFRLLPSGFVRCILGFTCKYSSKFSFYAHRTGLVINCFFGPSAYLIEKLTTRLPRKAGSDSLTPKVL